MVSARLEEETEPMLTARAKQIPFTFLIGAMAALVVASLGYGVRESLLERWYLPRLESPDAAIRRAAAERLGELGSLRAFPWLTNAAREHGLHGFTEGHLGGFG